MDSVMICLVGEQPAPNLLPIRHCQPEIVVFVYTKTTEKVKNNLDVICKIKHQVHSLEISPYNLTDILEKLQTYIHKHQWNSKKILFNITGGTKPMALAAFRLAEILQTKVIYFQSEGGQSLLYQYTFQNNELREEQREIINAQITIDDYLKAYGLEYQQEIKNDSSEERKKGEIFEKIVYNTLEPHVCEMLRSVRKGALEIDLIIRCGNQIGIAEIKTGKKAKRKDGIDQLSTASQREFLGTYAKRFLIIDRHLEINNKDLASAHRIEVIELISAGSINLENEHDISENDKKRLIETVTKELKCSFLFPTQA